MNKQIRRINESEAQPFDYLLRPNGTRHLHNGGKDGLTLPWLYRTKHAINTK